MASRLNSDKVICGVLDDNFKKKVVKKRTIASLTLLESDYRLCRGGNSEQLIDLSTLWYP